MGSITLGPDISCSIWVDVGDLYYMMDKDTKSTSDSKYTCFVSFVPLGGGAAAAYCVDKVCPFTVYPSLSDLVCELGRGQGSSD